LQFSDFAKYIDNHVTELKDRKVLMYCTGGVRCERASSYLRSKGIQDVSQLSGGIHAYQEDFPDGGFFRGKNFVFDPRLYVPSKQNPNDTIGECVHCRVPYDDYSGQHRCSVCRVLMLLCEGCFASDPTIASALVCEKCASKSDSTDCA
jgi:predicted sulfurtransferase